ncbi:hypothetical protein [Liquorilactobacillus mali]|uniref:Uncharacterized protein n=1 Tax=Liquorilactobacillus mali KCTC 3596 = DSM 20444 TaxID=1046596 RepID=A0A0R2E5F2_9LACO|nr:hypothetical protein [Liquorilactobacillus mali]KRN10822.1 hypothetical protein FD00_GL002065 [Liquorilactobacillus mali KCTC 3596 = DSM 20444]
MNVKRVKLPIHFEQIEDEMDKDSRFKKVKIYIAHTGENLNNSIFSKETLLEMAKTLPYVPIIGYINKDNSDESDFGGHEKNYKLEEDGNIEVTFKTQAYGFVGEDNDYCIETTGGKEWLTCYGYLWTRFSDAIDIFNESGDMKGQSMEISDARGSVNENGVVVYTSATITGLCILGDNKTPAMTGSTISTVFTKKEMKETFKEMFYEFSQEKGVNVLEKKNVTGEEETVEEKPLKPAENEVADSAENEAETETESETETENEETEETDTNDGDADTEETSEPAEQDLGSAENEAETAEESGETETETREKSQFELSQEDIRSRINSALNDLDTDDYWSYIVETYSDYFITQSYDSESDGYIYIKYNYSVDDNDQITIDLSSKTQVFSMFVDANEKANIEQARDEISDLRQQLSDLETFRSDYEATEKNKILNEQFTKLSDEQTESIKSQFEKLTAKEVEKEVAYAIFQNENKKSNSSNIAIYARNFEKPKDKTSRYGAVGKYFKNKE